MPLVQAQKILQHGFSKGSGRVGRTTKLDLDEKCTLAVIAHARHVMTPYDRLLKEFEPTHGQARAREEAREAIKHRLAEVLKDWRPSGPHSNPRRPKGFPSKPASKATLKPTANNVARKKARPGTAKQMKSDKRKRYRKKVQDGGGLPLDVSKLQHDGAPRIELMQRGPPGPKPSKRRAAALANARIREVSRLLEAG